MLEELDAPRDDPDLPPHRGGHRRLGRNSTRTIMALSFPNQSRFWDPTRRAVRFWGHDRSMESVFFVTEDALRRLQPSMQFGEVDLLKTFDMHRDVIHATAAKVYARGRKGSYDLLAVDF